VLLDLRAELLVRADQQPQQLPEELRDRAVLDVLPGAVWQNPVGKNAREICCIYLYYYVLLFYLLNYNPIPWRDSISRPIAPVSSVAYGDDTT
jgi:hypothetical protein